jgi:hypothetical protein
MKGYCGLDFHKVLEYIIASTKTDLIISFQVYNVTISYVWMIL